MSGDEIGKKVDHEPDNVYSRGMFERVVEEDKKGLVPDPVTGQGCVRGDPFIHPTPNPWDDSAWPLPPSPMPGPVFTEDEKECLQKTIQEMGEQLGEGKDGGGWRMNKGKLRMDLIPPEWDTALADVLTKGAEKYDDRNWEKGMGWASMIGCIKRHINKFLVGERYDGDKFDVKAGTTGCHHLAMAAWNCLALMTYDLRQIGENDLPSGLTLQLLERVNAESSDLLKRIHAETEKKESW